MESLHLEGDHFVQEAATTGLLAGIQNIAGNSGVDPEEFRQYLNILQSPFFSKFSLRELVERNKPHRGLDCSACCGGGGGSTGAVSRKESYFHKGESFSCQIASPEQFDEGRFIAALKQTIETELNQSKAKIIGTAKSDAASFYFEYTREGTRGKVEVSGRKTPGNFYSLSADLAEKY